MLEFYLAAPVGNNTHYACSPMTVRNFMYSGGLVAYNKVSASCNARLADGTPVECDLLDATACPAFILPYADLQPNLLCAVDDTLVAVARAAVNQISLLYDFVDGLFIHFLNCLYAGQCTLPPSPEDAMAIANELLCNTEVRTSLKCVFLCGT